MTCTCTCGGIRIDPRVHGSGCAVRQTGFTRKPLTVREWLENVMSRGGDDAEWAHLLLQQDRSPFRTEVSTAMELMR